MAFILPIAISFIVSLLLIPFVKKFAIKIGAVDKPNKRKVHTKNYAPFRWI